MECNKRIDMNKRIIYSLCGIVCGILIGLMWVWVGGSIYTTNKNHTLDVYRQRLELKYYGTKDTLVSAVDEYIQKMAPGSCLNGLTVVNECEKHEIDLPFVLAQGRIESHFATKGIASKTHSVFNVYSYDGKSAEDIKKSGHAYSHPDESVEPYIKLLKKYYLNDGKTEMDLMDKYVNFEGKRYATDKNYESKLLSAYKDIHDSTSIDELWEKFMKYKMLAKK